MKVISSQGRYYAMHVVEDDFEYVSWKGWKGWNWKKWHVGIFAKTRHGLTLVGVVSAGSSPDTFTWWANCRGEFEAEICSLAKYSAPDTDVLTYCGSRRDFLDCVEAAAAFLTDDDDY